MKHKNHLRAKSYHVNCFGEVSTPYLFWYMQEIAWEHARLLGFGFEDLAEDQLFWVLSRLLFKVNRRPKWTEEFTLETWSRGTDGFFAYRDYTLIDQKGNILLEGTSSWLILNASTRRLQRFRELKSLPPYQDSSIGYNAGKVASPINSVPLIFSPVTFNEIDINQHFNTGRYLERINNCYSFDFHQHHDLIELEVNMVKEGMHTDAMAVKRQELSPLEHLCSIVRESDGAELIRARLVWQQKALSGIGI